MMAKNNTPNPTDGRMKDKEVNAISDYLKPNMPLPQYLPYARFLLDTDLSHTAKLLYTLLLDQATRKWSCLLNNFHRIENNPTPSQ